MNLSTLNTKHKYVFLKHLYIQGENKKTKSKVATGGLPVVFFVLHSFLPISAMTFALLQPSSSLNHCLPSSLFPRLFTLLSFHFPFTILETIVVPCLNVSPRSCQEARNTLNSHTRPEKTVLNCEE